MKKYRNSEVREMWRENVKPYVVEQYSEDDVIALRESFSNYCDMLCKDREITEYQYENIAYPSECE